MNAPYLVLPWKMREKTVLPFYVSAVPGAKNRRARAVLNSRVQLCLLACGVPCGKLVFRQGHQRGKKKMTVWEFTVLVWIGSAVAGLLGSLTGLGGGVVLVPLLTLFFKVDIRYAIGASLISVIATSSGAAAAYVKEGLSNIRIGMFLEIATTLGALFRSFPGRQSLDVRYRHHIWRGLALLRVFVRPGSRPLEER